ncbi:MAG: cytochrome b/b6 domain-containing protein, partial [Alphaproteobacteria bacterium]
MRQILVWDIATRLFHWSLALLVIVCFLTGEDEGLIFAIHAYAGFAVLP